jgi:hypothetical protein
MSRSYKFRITSYFFKPRACKYSPVVWHVKEQSKASKMDKRSPIMPEKTHEVLRLKHTRRSLKNSTLTGLSSSFAIPNRAIPARSMTPTWRLFRSV